MTSVKKIRLDEAVNNATVILNAAEIISFVFDDSDPIPPQFVHQNFGQSGDFEWPTDLLPLRITIRVLTSEQLQSVVQIEHGGDYECYRSVRLRGEIISKLKFPCELEGGNKPAVYPGNLEQFERDAFSSDMKPSEVSDVAGGSCVERYSSKDFQKRSLNVWKRAEWLMLWYIESVSQSQHETDPHWDYYFLKDARGRIVSFCSVYIFPSFSFLSKGFIGDRVRLSQFLTIPSEWKRGTGSLLLRHIVENVKVRDDVDKFTMEEPSFGMTSLRESVYLALAKQDKLLDVRDVTVDELESILKIPRSFAKRIKNLLELRNIRGSRSVDESLVDRVLASGNKYVQKFIDSIEFYDDIDEEDLVGDSAEKTRLLVRSRVFDALKKIEKICV